MAFVVGRACILGGGALLLLGLLGYQFQLVPARILGLSMPALSWWNVPVAMTAVGIVVNRYS